MWVDRCYYTLHHPEMWEGDELHIAFCPEGYYKPGDIIRNGDWSRTVVKVVPRIKEANAYLKNLWRGVLQDERPEEN